MNARRLVQTTRAMILSATVLTVGLARAADTPGDLAAVRVLITDGRYADAEHAARELLARVESVDGRESLAAANTLDALVESMSRGGKATDPETIRLAGRALSVKEKILGPEHLDVATSLNGLGRLALDAGDFALAQERYERVLAIREKALGPDHPDVGASLNNLGLARSGLGDFAGARSLLERSLGIKEKAVGPDHPSVAASLNSLARVLAATGDHAAARRLQERAQGVWEKAVGPDHPNVAAGLNNLAIMLRTVGDYAGAQPLYERALSIREKALGSNHPAVAASLDGLGNLLVDMGDYATALRLYERGLAIREEALGQQHPDVATSLGNLANLLATTGDFVRARQVGERALAIQEAALGPGHPDVASSLNNLATILLSAGEDTGALRLLERALAIDEKTLGPEHARVALILYNMAGVLYDAGDTPGSLRRHARALAIREEALGPEHPDVARSLTNLGLIHYFEGDDARAQQLFERAMAIDERTLGAEHPSAAADLRNLGMVLASRGDSSRAMDCAVRADEISRNHVALTCRSLSERQALQHAAIRESGLDVALSIVSSGREASARRRAWDAVIRSRALVLDEMCVRRRTRIETPEVRALAEANSSAAQRLANLVVRGAGDEPPERYRKLLDDARLEQERAERALAERSASFRSERARARLGLADVEAALPTGAALVAFSRYTHHDVATGPVSLAARSTASLRDSATYLAFILRGAGNEPHVVALGAAAEIDALASRWREAILPPEHPPAESATGDAACREAGDALRRRIWDPLIASIEGAGRVFVVPDGALNLVAFAALPTGDATYLAETGPLLHYLSAERDLVAPPAQSLAARGQGLLAFGAPTFDGKNPSLRPASGPAQASSTGLLATLASLLPFRGATSTCRDFTSLRFRPLPGAELEAREVVAAWNARPGREADAIPAVPLTGASATEAMFKAGAPGNRILHLATHGFFVGAACGAAPPTTRGATLAGDGARARRDGASESPLLLSGLVFAGANDRAAADPATDDGILTSEEIASLDLSAVEWAVLSACDTGLGDIRASEGVFGLRRAFQVAGARTLVMSLWSVEDESARQWMKGLYEARLDRGLDTAESVRAASLSVLGARRESGLSTHPFHWAGFVAAGDWR